MSNILVLFHCESNPGFAASSHELTFLKMALNIVGDYQKVHFAYKTLENGLSPHLPKELTNIIEFDSRSTDVTYLKKIQGYIKKNDISIIFGFDQPVKRKAYRYLREGGVKTFISYQGAPMSSEYKGLLLLARKIQVKLSRHRPDHFIFQSEGMRYTATNGCGIPLQNTSIVRTGIDVEKYSPDPALKAYAYDQFNIPKDRKIVIFSGHMERRKGVWVIIETAKYIVQELKRSDVHFLILGNRDGQKDQYDHQYIGTKAENFITFGGYRKDIPTILKSCSIGMIASTGWDSFPMSSIEIAATEIPLLVSDLEGLREAVTDETGFRFPVGDYETAGKQIAKLIDDETLRCTMGQKGRQRAIQQFSVNSQIEGITDIVRDRAKHLDKQIA